jgi:pimeloyl-ACP methyl ester carboxylesterase
MGKIPPRNGRLLHARIRGSKLVLYAGAGHGFMFQTPLAAGRRFDSFLG